MWVRHSLDDKDGSDPIYVYSRSTGLFGGAAFEGAKLGFDDDYNAQFYGRPLTATEIFQDPSLPAPAAVSTLKDALWQAQ